MLRDTPPLYPSAPIPPSPPSEPPPHPHTYAANTALDDVFGDDSSPHSPPPSAPLQPQATPPVAPEQGDANAPANANTEPSDIPRLRSVHVTSGYRDGIASAKASFVQAGFDEGFSLGAELGMRVGRVLGVLEGCVGALGNAGRGGEGEGRRKGYEEAKRMLGRARRELSRMEVLGERWFDGEGVWRFEVGEGEEEGEVTFREVADAHPVVRRWREEVERLVGKWGVDLGVLGRRERGEDEGGE